MWTSSTNRWGLHPIHSWTIFNRCWRTRCRLGDTDVSEALFLLPNLLVCLNIHTSCERSSNKPPRLCQNVIWMRLLSFGSSLCLYHPLCDNVRFLWTDSQYWYMIRPVTTHLRVICTQIRLPITGQCMTIDVLRDLGSYWCTLRSIFAQFIELPALSLHLPLQLSPKCPRARHLLYRHFHSYWIEGEASVLWWCCSPTWRRASSTWSARSSWQSSRDFV